MKASPEKRSGWAVELVFGPCSFVALWCCFHLIIWSTCIHLSCLDCAAKSLPNSRGTKFKWATYQLQLRFASDWNFNGNNMNRLTTLDRDQSAKQEASSNECNQRLSWFKAIDWVLACLHIPAIPLDPNMEQIHAMYTLVISWSLHPFSENNCPRVISAAQMPPLLQGILWWQPSPWHPNCWTEIQGRLRKDTWSLYESASPSTAESCGLSDEGHSRFWDSLGYDRNNGS